MSGKLVTTVLMALGAVACGGLAAFLGHQYIQGTIDQERRALEARYDPIEVVVAARDLSAGDTLGSHNAAVRQVPRVFLHGTAIRSSQWASAEGRSLRENVGQGEAILSTHLAQSGEGFRIPDGHRAITLPVDRESAIAGFLEPGDRVDLLLTMSSPRDGTTFTFALLEAVTVAAVDGRISRSNMNANDGNGHAPARTITIAVTPEDVSRITHARRAGNLTVSLRQEGDVQRVGIEPMSEDALAREYLGEMDDRTEIRAIEVIIGRGG